MTAAARTRITPPGNGAAYAAAVWGFAFAALSAYWGLGGELGVAHLGVAIREQVEAHDRGFLVLVWFSVVGKVIAALIALALVRAWVRGLPRRLLRVAAWALGVGFTLYGGAGIVQAALITADVLDAPRSQGEGAVIWYLLLWEPIWLLGGLCFLAAAWQDRQRSRLAESPRQASILGNNNPRKT